MDPYRDKQAQQAIPQPETGFVAEMVRQFADPYALWRELVQNSIDAGATELRVTLHRSADGVVRSALADDGCGMTPEVVEGNLLTLFSSTKEGDESKVGKYGVGFVSVFSLDPGRVVVETWRDGHCYRLELGRDHSYELLEVEPRQGSGTVVALENTFDVEAFQRHVEASRAALTRWCRHARVPITLFASDETGFGDSKPERIDVPFGLPALVTLTHEALGERFVVGAGSVPEAPPSLEAHEHFSGFYKRGLTLYESDTELFSGIEGVRFKVESEKLSHTLSRDNVRRDDELVRVLEMVKQLSRGPLRERLVERLAVAARERDRASYLALLTASSLPGFGLGAAEVTIALTDAVGGATAMTVRELEAATPWRKPVLTATAPDALTAALAAQGRPVVWTPSGEVERRLASFFDPRALLNPRSCRPAHQELVLLEALPDVPLCQHLAAILAATSLGIRRARLARVCGELDGRCALAVPSGATLLARNDLGRGGPELWLDANAPAVVLALRKYDAQPAEVAQLVARLVLLELGGALSERDADHLLHASIRELG